MNSKCKVWRYMLLVAVVLTVVVVVIMTSRINKQVPSEDLEYLTNKLPIEVSMTFLSQKSNTDFAVTDIESEKISAIAKLLYNAKKHARGSKTSAYLGLAIAEMNKLLNSLNMTPETVYTRATQTPINVCSERFKGGQIGFPLYYTGFERQNCAHSIPLSNLITIVKHFSFNNSDLLTEAVNKFLSSVSLTFPNVSVMLSTNSKIMTNTLHTKYPDVHTFIMNMYSEGSALNMMISNVKTQYVLVARGVEYFTNDSRLERLIGEIESLNVVLAGGSFRFQNGHWSKGCFQVLYRNFTLKYYEGYDESFHECLFCDFIQGPFVSNTKYFVRNKFEDLNEHNGLYEDMFLRIFQKGKESVICPDSMFHTIEKTHQHVVLDSFMHKWRLSEMFTVEGLKVHLDSNVMSQKRNRFQFPSLNNLQKASHAVKTIMHACMEAGVMCELQEGTELGAVKMGKILPWDIDFDIRFLSNNCSQCRNLENVFRERDIYYGDFVKSCCTKKLKLGEINYVGAGYNQYHGDISGHPILDSVLLAEKDIEPTRILFDGVWVNVPRNPGLSMRNRYGREIYQHAEHWRFTGGNSSTGYHRMNYTTNVFLPCLIFRSHDCLDRFNADGNLQFEYLLP